MCGKDLLVISEPMACQGSPPHVRERPRQAAMEFLRLRITPACAGKTVLAVSETDTLWDHPRMCGKDRPAAGRNEQRAGSPPHVRERLPSMPIRKSKARITPACAGKTVQDIEDTVVWEDHPRMCGKDLRPVTAANSLRGSPPHVRERRTRPTAGPAFRRITPACAGKTGSQRGHGPDGEDHPRMCGKDPGWPLLHLPDVGSPPHVRERRFCPP